MEKAKKIITPRSAAEDLIACLARATADDLATIDNEIEKLNAELDAEVNFRKKAIDALVAARKTVDFAVNGKKARKTPVRKAARKESSTVAPPEKSTLATEIRDLLDAEGSMPVAAIAARLGHPPAVIGMLTARSSLFEKLNGEVHIAKGG